MVRSRTTASSRTTVKYWQLWWTQRIACGRQVFFAAHQRFFQQNSGFKIASRLDLADSFNQLPIRASYREKTTFTFNGKRFMFNGAPFGVKILTAHLQQILSKLLENFSAIFVDDIVVFSQSEEQHVDHLSLLKH